MVINYLPESLIVFLDKEELNSAEQERSMEAGKDDERERQKRYQEKGISIKAGMSYSGGNMEVYFDLIKTFLKDKSRHEQDIRKFLAEENMLDYETLTHALKSNARMLGADHLADIFYEHEKAGKEKNAEYANKHLEEML